jgi:hypothetical protein
MLSPMIKIFLILNEIGLSRSIAQKQNFTSTIEATK